MSRTLDKRRKLANAASAASPEQDQPPIASIVAMIHVADVESSTAFYRMLGFEIGNKVPRIGKVRGAWLYAPKAELEGRSEPDVDAHCRPLNPDGQDVLFYLYATDLVALRTELIAHGVKVGEIGYPDYLPEGEFRGRTPMVIA